MATKKRAAAVVEADEKAEESSQEEATKEELYEAAQEADIEGRSTMNKEELAQALEEVEEEEEVVLTPATKRATVNSTWPLHYGGAVYDFVAGQTYDVPVDVYEYLKAGKNLQAHL